MRNGLYAYCAPDAQTVSCEASEKRPETRPESLDYRAKVPSIYAHPYVPRENTGGNFCGHDPKNPHFALHSNPYKTGESIDDLGDKRRSTILYTIVDKITAYYDDPDSIHPFNTANRHKRKTDRQRNSARREALIAITQVMVMNMDLSTYRVGFPTDNGFINRSVNWIAKQAKLSKRRTERALSDLIAAGIISSKQYREIIDLQRKEYRFYTAIRTFNTAFFEVLGIPLKALRKAKEYVDQKREQAIKIKYNSEGQRMVAALKLSMQSIINRDYAHENAAEITQEQMDKDEREYQKKQQREKNHADARQRSAIVMQVMQNQPELKDDEKALRKAIEAALAAAGVKAQPV